MNKTSLEEVVKVLEDMKVAIPLPQAAQTQKKRNDALDAAITALNCLEKLNSSDCISRQAAIDSMCELMRHWFGCDSKDEIREIKRELGKLPPAQLEQRWIPCSERLPDEKDAGILKKLGIEKRSEDVLATVEVKGERMTVTICTYDGKWEWDMKYAFPDHKVIAWMPLPEPYRGEGEKHEGSD